MRITGTNLYALGKLFGVTTVHGRFARGTGVLQEPLRSVPNAIESTSRNHLKRCMAAGLLEPQGDRLILTDEGNAALLAAMEGYTR